MRGVAILLILFAAGPMDLFRQIRKAQDAYDLPTFYRLSRELLKKHPDHRSADIVRYELAAQLMAENLKTRTSAEATEAIALLRHASEKARSEGQRFDAALLLLKFEPHADPSAAAVVIARRFERHRNVDQIYMWAIAELEQRNQIVAAADWARQLLAMRPRTSMRERCERLMTRAQLINNAAPFTPQERAAAVRAGGRILLLDFWATWCAPCVRGIPRLVAFHEKNHPKGLRIIGFDMDDEKEALDAFVEQHGIRWEMIPARFESDVDERFGIKELPSYVIVDQATGRILETELEGDALFSRLEALLAR